MRRHFPLRVRSGPLLPLDACAQGLCGRGVTSALIAAALQAAKRAGAPTLEAYPFDADVSPSASGAGSRSPSAADNCGCSTGQQSRPDASPRRWRMKPPFRSLTESSPPRSPCRSRPARMTSWSPSTARAPRCASIARSCAPGSGAKIVRPRHARGRIGASHADANGAERGMHSRASGLAAGHTVASHPGALCGARRRARAAGTARPGRAKSSRSRERSGAAFFFNNRAFRIDRARHELGYRPRVTIEAGLQRLASWHFECGHLARAG